MVSSAAEKLLTESRCSTNMADPHHSSVSEELLYDRENNKNNSVEIRKNGEEKQPCGDCSSTSGNSTQATMSIRSFSSLSSSDENSSTNRNSGGDDNLDDDDNSLYTTKDEVSDEDASCYTSDDYTSSEEEDDDEDGGYDYVLNFRENGISNKSDFVKPKTLPAPTNQYKIVSLSFLETNVATSVVSKVFDESLRMLRPGGLLYVVDRDGSTVKKNPKMRQMLTRVIEPTVKQKVHDMQTRGILETNGYSYLAEGTDGHTADEIVRWMLIKPKDHP